MLSTNLNDQVSVDYYPFGGKEQATFSLQEGLSFNDLTKSATAVDTGFCRFSFSERAPDQPQRYSHHIDIGIQKLFPDSRKAHLIVHQITTKGAHVDVEMDNIAPSRWTPTIEIDLPDGEKLQYHSKGVEIPAHYMLMSVNMAKRNHSVEQICEALRLGLDAATIEDVWVQYWRKLSSGSTQRLRTGIFYFVICLSKIKEASGPAKPPAKITYQVANSTNEVSATSDAECLVFDLKAAAQRQPAWLLLPSGKEHIISFRHRLERCDTCRSSAKEFHERKDCPFYQSVPEGIYGCKPTLESYHGRMRKIHGPFYRQFLSTPSPVYYGGSTSMTDREEYTAWLRGQTASKIDKKIIAAACI